MSYAIVKKIKVRDNKVLITSAANNVRPLSYSEEECPTFTKVLVEEGTDALNVQLLRNYEEGNLQAGKRNKYTRALKVLIYVLGKEYEQFDWRKNTAEYASPEYKARYNRRATKKFDELLLKALKMKIPTDRWCISKKIGNIQYFADKITIRHIRWTENKAYAKKYKFEGEARDVANCFINGSTFIVEKI